MVPADSARISRVPAYSGAVWRRQQVFAYGAFTLCGAAFQPLRLTSAVRSGDGPTTPREALPPPRFGLLRVRSPLLAQSLVCFLFLRVLRCFSSPGSPPSSMDAGLAPGGLPHSEIRGCAGICPSPRLIAACHVLRRLPVPRHPPCAFSILPAPRSRGGLAFLTLVCFLVQLHIPGPRRGPGDQMRPLPAIREGIASRAMRLSRCGGTGPRDRVPRHCGRVRGDGGPPAGRARLRELRFEVILES